MDESQRLLDATDPVDLGAHGLDLALDFPGRDQAQRLKRFLGGGEPGIEIVSFDMFVVLAMRRIIVSRQCRDQTCLKIGPGEMTFFDRFDDEREDTRLPRRVKQG